jgi:hypothetical protein
VAFATLMAALLIGCAGPDGPASGIDSQDTLTETPEAPEPAPTAAPQTPSRPENTLIETPEYTGIVVSESGVSEFSYLFDEASTRFWEPSPRDISTAEKRVRLCIVAVEDDPNLDAYQQERVAFILENLEKYRRQYVGIEVEGAKRIWINAFFSDRLYVDWTRSPVDVEDGGNRYWQMEVDLLSDECINFHIQGDA